MMTNEYPSKVPPAGQQRRGAQGEEPIADPLSDAVASHSGSLGDSQGGSMSAGVSAGTADTGSGTGDDTGSDMKDKAAHLAEDASDAGHHVADVAKDEARRVTAETGTQARKLLRDARDELREQAASQQVRVADGIRSVGTELSGMAANSENPGLATDLVQQASSRADSIAAWLDAREPGSLIEEVKTFARQRPGVFIAVAAGAGILAGRLTRALAEPQDSSAGSGTGASAPSAGSADVPVGGLRRGDVEAPDMTVPGAYPTGGL